MKKILLILALMLPMVVFTACEKEGDDLIGTWVNNGSSEYIAYVQFNEDHTGCFGYTDGDVNSFTWSTSGNHLTIDFGNDPGEFIYSISGDCLTLSCDDCEEDEFVFKRK